MLTRTELVNKVLAETRKKHKGLSDDILCLTIFDVRRIIENTVEDTKKHIAKKLVENREGFIEFLTAQGFISGVESPEDLEELVIESLNEL